MNQKSTDERAGRAMVEEKFLQSIQQAIQDAVEGQMQIQQQAIQDLQAQFKDFTNNYRTEFYELDRRIQKKLLSLEDRLQDREDEVRSLRRAARWSVPQFQMDEPVRMSDKLVNAHSRDSEIIPSLRQ